MKANKDNAYAYNNTLKEFARANRNSSTKSEAYLWKYVLKAKMMGGYAFRRQRPVLNYIADFMCKELMLIIEIDGITHDHPDAVVADRNRQRELENAGFSILRFDEDNVLTNIENVLAAIENWIEANENQTLPLDPPPRGGKRLRKK